MQLGRHALILATLIAPSLHAQDSVSFEVLSYEEGDDRVSAQAVNLGINKDFGVDYHLYLNGKIDHVSGASPTWKEGTDTVSGASESTVVTGDPVFGNVAFDDDRYSGEAVLTVRGAKRDETSIGIGGSMESDYLSRRLFVNRMVYEDANHNRSYSYGASLSDSLIVVPAGNQIDTTSGASSVENATALMAHGGMTQVISRNAHATFGLAIQQESGYLNNNYKKIVRQSGSTLILSPDSRPDSRTGWAVSGEYAQYLPGLLTTVHLGYRYYRDDWSICSDTVDLAFDYEPNKTWTVSPFWRRYSQSRADFYSDGYFGTTTADEFGSSDERLSAFDAHTYGLHAKLKEADIAYKGMINYYEQTTGLEAWVISVGIEQEF